MKVNLSELIDPKLMDVIPSEHQSNLVILLHKVNLLREASQIPFFIRNDTDRKRAGYRTKQMHIELYEELSIKYGKIIKPPERSWHLFGGACDISDRGGAIKSWVKGHEEFCKTHGMYFEHFDYTPSFVHLQIYAPPSLQMYFIP